MGRAHAIVSIALLDLLRRVPLAGQVNLVNVKIWDDRLHLVAFTAPALSDGFHGRQDIIVEGNSVRFKKGADV